LYNLIFEIKLNTIFTFTVQGLAAGTLLYITFFEVLSREKLTRYRMTGIIGVLAIALGFTVMAVMEGTGSHTHSHGGPAPARQLGGSGLNHSGTKINTVLNYL